MNMNELDNCRKKIDEIDTEMKRLFLCRMKVAEEIATIKKKEGLPIYQPEREAFMLEKRSEGLEGEMKQLYISFLKQILTLSKEHQKNNEE